MRSRAPACPPPLPVARRLRVRAAMHTDPGVVRDRNEDAVHVDADLQLYLVADGVGGSQAGDVASTMAIDLVRASVEAQRATLAAFATAPSDDGRQQLKRLLAGSVRQAHQAIRARAAREADKHGMATTLDVALVAGRDVFIAHVGDSRTYLVRGGLASQLTRDHTMAQVMVMAGTLAPDEAASSPMAAVVLNAVGAAPEVTVDVVHLELRDGDRLLLCSDGLYGYFNPEELAERLTRGAPNERLIRLVALARSRGGHDNITGVIVEITAAGLPLTAQSDPARVGPRARRLAAVGTAPPGSGPDPVPVPDPWEDETTLPRTPPLPPSTGLAIDEAGVPHNPLSSVTEDALSGFVEYSLYEESRPYDVPIEPRAG